MKAIKIKENPNINRYRIIEYNGMFTIVVESEIFEYGILYEIKKLWSKDNIKKDWVLTDINGNPSHQFSLLASKFKTLKEALNKIKEWKKGTITYEIKEHPIVFKMNGKLCDHIVHEDGTIEIIVQ